MGSAILLGRICDSRRLEVNIDDPLPEPFLLRYCICSFAAIREISRCIRRSRESSCLCPGNGSQRREPIGEQRISPETAQQRP